MKSTLWTFSPSLAKLIEQKRRMKPYMKRQFFRYLIKKYGFSNRQFI